MKTKTLVALGALLALATLAPTAAALERECYNDYYADPTYTVELYHNYCVDPEGSPTIAGSFSGHVGPKPVHNYYWAG